MYSTSEIKNTIPKGIKQLKVSKFLAHNKMTSTESILSQEIVEEYISCNILPLRISLHQLHRILLWLNHILSAMLPRFPPLIFLP